MRPLFTVHAGEFLVGEHIENTFSSLNVWVPAKDTGVDLLVTDAGARHTASLQVKLSRDYRLPEATEDFDRSLIAAGWLTLDHGKIEKSPAEWWVIVLVSHERKMKPQFIVIPPSELLSRLVQIHGKSKKYHFYPWVTKSGLCLEGRGLRKSERALLAKGKPPPELRDLSTFLNNWSCLQNLGGVK
ncbi:MAG: hypothetical protein B7Y56_11775 [Gallionellales bacterium 35-53-114]|jgi:hypothetical protein|nr:MAG: hypothetical protein B7Y56_11775 [Gallionellales bacterium 35-53-114]OYZ64720.1 MAG: hypothetical protein B7Y04_02825 [Gallionellales bacterium 24-53-125]OZB07741.1 MAG: hypothetical protein B7X61_14190 [Gallionellales bacterium 39-52-133]HQS58552.1 hypothetical protein [Gallionellaceae bacterium]HQS74893.1 hypothetical protein [Gallionellaceae bacterium]